MSDAEARLPKRLWPRSRRRQTAICVLLLAAGGVLAEWYHSQPDTQVETRIAVLKKDPILSAFRAELGRPNDPVTRWKCTMELPPAYSEDFHAQADAETVQRVAGIARGAGWTTRINPQPDQTFTIELHKTFRTWTSDSLVLLHQGDVTIELDAVDNNHAAC